jgi:hypothetical protein
VIFRQHPPGRMGLSDFTDMGGLGIMIEMNTEVGPKRFGPFARVGAASPAFGVLVNPKNVLNESAVKEAQGSRS